MFPMPLGQTVHPQGSSLHLLLGRLVPRWEIFRWAHVPLGYGEPLLSPLPGLVSGRLADVKVVSWSPSSAASWQQPRPHPGRTSRSCLQPVAPGHTGPPG